MIITCPNCATRYQADAAKFPAAGRKVKCAKCGHAWHQDPPAPEPVVEAEEPIIVQPEPPPPPPPPEPEPVIEEPPPQRQAFAPEPERAVPIPVRTAPTYEAHQESRGLPQLSGGRIGVLVGWALLALIVLGIIGAVVSYRRDIATAWPQTASLYSLLGMPVNARGIDFTDVSYKREKQDGQFVLAITGKLVNSSGREQPVSQIRAALSDDDGRELYHWTFSPGITTMRPGQTAKFLTRISSPPPRAKNLEVRFAADGE
jgi:predicted Zn finger-like uncharacterized protein